MGRAGFLAHQDVADALVAEQGVVDRQHRAAGIAEHEFDPQPHQAVDQDVRAAALFAHFAVSFEFEALHKRATRRGLYRTGSSMSKRYPPKRKTCAP